MASFLSFFFFDIMQGEGKKKKKVYFQNRINNSFEMMWIIL
jgi:hypothetical protein